MSTSQNTVVTGLDRDVVNVGAQLVPIIQKMYSIFLWDLDREEVVEDPRLDPARTRPTAEYFFTTPPQKAEITEPFASRVIPTQNGGKFIESHGSLFKNIRIEGTTGLRPRKGLPNQIPLLPSETFNRLADTLTGDNFAPRKIPKEEVTGFDDIHFLRNIFRRYSDSKSRNEHIVMVYRNIKDNDYWVVEPQDFRLSMDSKNPLTYQYNISLQGLSPFNPVPVRIEDDPLAVLRSSQRVVARLSEIKQTLTSSFLVLATQIRRIQGFGYFAINNTLGTLTSVIRAVTEVVNASTSFRENLIRAASQAREEFREALDALTDSLPVVTVGRSSGVEDRDPVIHEVMVVIRNLEKILADPELRNSVAREERDRRERAREAYRDRNAGTGGVGSPRTGGDPTSVSTSSSPTTVAEGVVGEGDTLRDLASRYLGDARRWHELAIINNLKAPYTTDGARLPGVLSPGDKFLYPSAQATSSTVNVLPSTSTDEQENSDGILSQTYGRDLRLVSVEGSGDVDSTDIKVNNRGDLSTVVGVDNVQQAIRLRFLTEQGELPAHPRFGARFPIGSKADQFSFNTFRVNTLATIVSDPRIEDVEDLEFLADGDILSVTGKLKLVDAQDYVSTYLELRRL